MGFLKIEVPTGAAYETKSYSLAAIYSILELGSEAGLQHYRQYNDLLYAEEHGRYVYRRGVEVTFYGGFCDGEQTTFMLNPPAVYHVHPQTEEQRRKAATCTLLLGDGSLDYELTIRNYEYIYVLRNVKPYGKHNPHPRGMIGEITANRLFNLGWHELITPGGREWRLGDLFCTLEQADYHSRV